MTPIPIRASIAVAAARPAPAGADRRRSGQSRPEILRRRGHAGRLRSGAADAGTARLPTGRNSLRRFLRHRQPSLRRRLGGRALCGDRGFHGRQRSRHASGDARRSSAARENFPRPTRSTGLYALQAYKAKLAPVIASVDLFCVPTAPTHYTVDAVLADPIVTNSRLGTYTNFVNLLDMCGIAVPTGKRERRPADERHLACRRRQGRPDGGARPRPPCGERPRPRRDRLAAAGHRRQQSATADDGMIELVVVGAHLSGMPLNGQLRALGARFCRAARTVACLSALRARRPVRAEAGAGARCRWRRRGDRCRGLAAFARTPSAASSPRSRRRSASARSSSMTGPRPRAFWSKPRALNGALRHFVIRRLAPLCHTQQRHGLPK